MFFKKELESLNNRLETLQNRVILLENVTSIYERIESPSTSGCYGYSGYPIKITDVKALLFELLDKLGYEVTSKLPTPEKIKFLNQKEIKNEQIDKQ